MGLGLSGVEGCDGEGRGGADGSGGVWSAAVPWDRLVN